ncbi:MAG: hypothetical protein Q8K43_04770, partial [Sulfurimicrobium sp.]|nr:hypothetical protein [Sulfurimicrobium sp.]
NSEQGDQGNEMKTLCQDLTLSFLASQFKEAGKSNLVLNVYPGADHRLSGNGISHRAEFFSELSRLLQSKHND